MPLYAHGPPLHGAVLSPGPISGLSAPLPHAGYPGSLCPSGELMCPGMHASSLQSDNSEKPDLCRAEPCWPTAAVGRWPTAAMGQHSTPHPATSFPCLPSPRFCLLQINALHPGPYLRLYSGRIQTNTISNLQNDELRLIIVKCKAYISRIRKRPY